MKAYGFRFYFLFVTVFILAGMVPMYLGNVGTHDAKMTQSDSDMSNDMSQDDMRAIAWKG